MSGSQNEHVINHTFDKFKNFIFASSENYLAQIHRKILECISREKKREEDYVNSADINRNFLQKQKNTRNIRQMKQI